METQTFAISAPAKARKIRRYVVAYQCPQCSLYGYLEDFSGTREAECCGASFVVEVD
jgi:hypothetical protein